MHNGEFIESPAHVNGRVRHSINRSEGHPMAYWWLAGVITTLLIAFLFISIDNHHSRPYDATATSARTPGAAAQASTGPAAQPKAPPAPAPENYAWKLAQGDGNRYGRDLYGEFIELMEVSRRLFPNDTERQIYDAVIMLREAGSVMEMDVGRLVCHQMLNDYADGQASSYEVAVGIMASEASGYARKKFAEEYLSGSKPLGSWAHSDTCIFCGARAARTYPICGTHAKDYRMAPNGFVQSLKDNLDVQLVWNTADQVYDIFVVRREN